MSVLLLTAQARHTHLQTGRFIQWTLSNREHVFAPTAHSDGGITKEWPQGVPAVAQPDGQRLGSPETRVQSPAQHSGLRIQHGCSFSLGGSCSSDLIPGLGTSCAAGLPKKIKKKKENGLRRVHTILFHLHRFQKQTRLSQHPLQIYVYAR